MWTRRAVRTLTWTPTQPRTHSTNWGRNSGSWPKVQIHTYGTFINHDTVMVWPTMVNILLCIITKQGCVDVNDNHVWWIMIYSDNNIYLRNRKSGFSVWSTQQWKSSSARKSSFHTVGNEHTQTLGLYLLKKDLNLFFFNLFFKLRFYSLIPKRQNKDEHFSPALWSMTTSYTEGLSFFSGDSLQPPEWSSCVLHL